MLQARSAIFELSAPGAADAEVRPGRRAPRALRWIVRAMLAVALTLTTTAGALRAEAWYHAEAVRRAPAIAPLELYPILFDVVHLTIPIAAGGEFATWRTTEQEVLASPVLWRRLHLAQWDSIPEPLRTRGLDNMLAWYGDVLLNPRQWDLMTVHDWDRIPQPIRIAAYRHMIAFWAGYYDLGRDYALPPRLVADTLAAIVMSESWFEHRAVVVNRHGNRDIGLAQASDYARERLRELYVADRVDVALADDEYLNPWLATRFVTVWMRLLLDEADGDLQRAVRAYHRGISAANGELGVAYGDTVRHRLTRYIRNQDAPAAWSYFWRHSEAMARRYWPWLAAERAQ